ncbi:MAG: hypothetical protein H6871_11770, partial [Methylobacteriaceae bacterium]|nr:hypothetical protein [Methylobacteriaceae bacterium]
MSVRFVRTLFSAAMLALAAASATTFVARAQTAAPSPAPEAPAAPAMPAPPPAAAPAPTEPPRVRTSERIDQAKSRLDQATAALRRDSLDDAALSNIKDALVPAADQLRQAIETLGPRLADA